MNLTDKNLTLAKELTLLKEMLKNCENENKNM